jgi:hypothetical protein
VFVFGLFTDLGIANALSLKLAVYRKPWLTRKFQARMKALSASSAGTRMSLQSICLGTGSFLLFFL